MTRRPRTRLDEQAAVELFRARFARPKNAATRLGIGDDAALLAPPRGLLAWTVDACVEGVHFERRLLALADVGYRAFQAAASDLAAMGARPLAALSALELPARFSARSLDELVRGQSAAARECVCPIIGGNIARSGALAVTTTLVGVTRRPLLRSGARPGDELWLVGAVGLAAAGLGLLRRFPKKRFRGAAARAVLAWRRPRALLAQGEKLAWCAHAVIDVSDGLAGDTRALARESGVAAVIDERALMAALPADLRALEAAAGRRALDLGLYGGEDYALVAAGPARRRPPWAKPIGRIELGNGAWLGRADGTRARLGRGYDHFRY